MEYRDAKYFNENDTYVFQQSTGLTFESKVEYVKGGWHTIESLEYKALSLPCKKK